jgi:phosphoribosyl 1,2-cyclic phosphate phosphodiesterase
LYAEPRVLSEIKTRFAYAFSPHPYPGLPQIELHPLDLGDFNLHDLHIQPIRVLHGRLPILGFRINNFAYITDASYIAEEEITKLQGLDILIINALRETDHFSHFTLDESLSYIEKINPGQAYITHISHNMGLYEDWVRKLPDRVRPLEDKMILYC